METWDNRSQEDRVTLLAWSQRPDNQKAFDRLCAKAVNLDIASWVTLPSEGKAECLARARQERAIAAAKAKRLAAPLVALLTAEVPPVSSDAGVSGKRASKRRWAARARQEQPETTRAAQRRYRDTHRAQIAEAQRLYRAAKNGMREIDGNH